MTVSSEAPLPPRGRPQPGQKCDPRRMGAPHSHRGTLAPDVQELFDLREPRIDPHNRGGTLCEQVVAEAASPVHLDEEAAEVGERVLARPQERAALAAEHAGLRAAGRDAFGVACAPAEKRGHPGRV